MYPLVKACSVALTYCLIGVTPQAPFASLPECQTAVQQMMPEVAKRIIEVFKEPGDFVIEGCCVGFDPRTKALPSCPSTAEAGA